MNFAAWRPKKKFPIQINPIREFRMDGKGIMVITGRNGEIIKFSRTEFSRIAISEIM